MKLRTILNFPLVVLIKVYQYLISPLIPNACRYEPTCSVYYIEALKKYGPLKGSYLGIKANSELSSLGRTWT